MTTPKKSGTRPRVSDSIVDMCRAMEFRFLQYSHYVAEHWIEKIGRETLTTQQELDRLLREYRHE